MSVLVPRKNNEENSKNGATEKAGWTSGLKPTTTGRGMYCGGGNAIDCLQCSSPELAYPALLRWGLVILTLD